MTSSQGVGNAFSLKRISGIHRNVRELVRGHWEPNAALGHGLDHADRVYDHAMRISEIVGADALCVGAASYLMDVGLNNRDGRKGHIGRSLLIAQGIIRQVPELARIRPLILECILLHEAESHSPPTSAEAMVLREADTLDRMGYSGVAMTLNYGKWIQRPLYSERDTFCDLRIPALDAYTFDYIVYLASLSGSLRTEVGARLGEEKNRQLRIFLERCRRPHKVLPFGYRDAFLILDSCRGT